MAKFSLLYSMKEQLVSVRESSDEYLQENQKLREEVNQQTVSTCSDTFYLVKVC